MGIQQSQIKINMDDETLKSIAGQLKQRHGTYPIQMGKKMNEGPGESLLINFI